VHALTEASKVSVPSIPHRVLKDFWKDDLDYLKQRSIDWKAVGSPRRLMDI